MISIYDVLKASKGIHVDDTFAELWGRKLSNAYTVATYHGTLPATLQTVEGYLESYKIYGNTEQAGTPTPENPIMPSGCGEMETTGAHAGQYKLPILSNSTVTNIYLGEVETTRRIKKLVLTGEEPWTLYNGNYYSSVTDRYSLQNMSCRCTHTARGIVINKGTARLKVFASQFTTVASNFEEWKSYLAAQYAAGTPVTVWYVLATEETGTLNEPLRKIRDYTDTIDSAQTSVQIPTAAGTTVIDYAGEGLAPSKIKLTYRKPKGQ